MYEHSQLNLFGQEHNFKRSNACLGDFRANHIALLGNVWHLMMSAIFGANCLESIAKLGQDGLWLKMSAGFCQAKMDGSLEEYSGIWPASGVMFGGTAFRHQRLVRYSAENGSLLLPAPIATDYKGTYKNTEKLMKHVQSQDHQVRISELLLASGIAKDQIPSEYENLMGFQTGWTELNRSETP